MASNFNDTTPAAVSGSTNVKFQTDGAGNDSAYVGPGLPIDIGVFAPGLGTAAHVLVRLALNRAIKFPASATLSHAVASAAATASTTFTLSKNGTPFATVNFAISSAAGIYTQASDSTFAAGDVLEIDGPGSADATLADVGITLAGLRV